MGFQEGTSKSTDYTLFPVKKRDGTMSYYVSDFSEELGNSVYKGYKCILKSQEDIYLPRRIKKEEITIDQAQAVAIKIYNEGQHPSPYQFYTSEIAVLNINGRSTLIMDLIDGFHIHPDASDNPNIKTLTYPQIVDIAWQLVLGLNHLHYENTSGPAIVHGDIKGENVKIRIKEINVDGTKQYKIDVLYLDIDYAKPITSRPQLSQGTPEHLALEVLDGYYSETSDFFALTPLLLSLFGAKNPLQKIIEFRNSNLEMEPADLVKKYRDIDFCTDGLFSHFEKKPEPLIIKLVEKFINSMGEKNKQNRPSPDAILEFFTALRQLSLMSELNTDTDLHKLRLCIAAKDEHWLNQKKYVSLLVSLDENIQSRLIKLLSLEQLLQFYKTLRKINESPLLMEHLRKHVADHLSEQCNTIQPLSLIGSFFFSPVTREELQWLLNCYVHQNIVEFYSPQKEKLREKLINCSETNLAPLISIVIDGFDKPIDFKMNHSQSR